MHGEIRVSHVLPEALAGACVFRVLRLQIENFQFGIFDQKLAGAEVITSGLLSRLLNKPVIKPHVIRQQKHRPGC